MFFPYHQALYKLLCVGRNVRQGCLFERVAMAECAGTGGAGLELGGGARVYQAVGLQRLQAGQRQATPLAHVVPTQRHYSQLFFFAHLSKQKTWFSQHLAFFSDFAWYSAVSPTLFTFHSPFYENQVFGFPAFFLLGICLVLEI
jgi:hypothetical protein